MQNEHSEINSVCQQSKSFEGCRSAAMMYARPGNTTFGALQTKRQWHVNVASSTALQLTASWADADKQGSQMLMI
jgi:hypothetical protein